MGKQVAGVPHLRLSSHPTWHAQVSAWDMWLDVPDSTMVDRWQANIVLREDIMTIAGLPPGKGGNRAPVVCTLSELSPFLLYQVGNHCLYSCIHPYFCMSLSCSAEDCECIRILNGRDTSTHNLWCICSRMMLFSRHFYSRRLSV